MQEDYNLDNAIRKIPDFPKPGILFYDITSILVNPGAFQYCIDKMISLYKNSGIQAIAAIESRGFIFAGPLAAALKLPLVIIRKKGKLPGETYSEDITLEYGVDTIEVHKADIRKGMTFLLIDDLIATGGTLKGAINLLSKGGASVKEVFGVVGLPFLNYDTVLKGYNVTTLINYHSE
jgi:adenine phosphoribosyltransferase